MSARLVMFELFWAILFKELVLLLNCSLALDLLEEDLGLRVFSFLAVGGEVGDERPWSKETA